MSKLVIHGAKPLRGEITVGGAKNSTLPLLAACILCRGTSVIHNCPRLSDVESSIKILTGLGCKCKREGNSVTVNTNNICCCEIPEHLMREMRSSIVFLGAIVARCGKAKLSTPGGCELGPRPIDLHLAAFRQLGMQIDEDHGLLHCNAKDGLAGTNITLSIPSVGATENVMLAASTARGTTVIQNAAREPEIIDLAAFLNKAGANIKGAGTGQIVIQGVNRLQGVEHTAIPDRITTATFMAAAAITGGRIRLVKTNPAYLCAVLSAFKNAGCAVEVKTDSIFLQAPAILRGMPTIRTMAYPGFPTDAGPTTLAMMTRSKGTTVFVETIFSNRFKFIDELKRLGAQIKTENNVAIVTGTDYLSGASVMSGDLRGGAALVVAGLAARGTTEVNGIHHIDRGYDSIETSLQKLGADIQRK